MFASAPRIDRRITNQGNNHVSTADTVAQMQAIVSASLNSPAIINACLDACQNLQYGCSDRDISDALWYWIKNHVRFVTDEQTMTAMEIPIENPTKELLIAPATLLAMPDPQGDCDDFSMLGKTMLAQCGIRSSFITIKAQADEPKLWTHIYVKVYLGDGSTMMFDSSHGHWPGWETRNYWEKREWV
jgi:hypothetical protein